MTMSVNIIDSIRPASGLLLFTTDKTHNLSISQAFKEHHIKRSYWIWVVGEPKKQVLGSNN